MPTFLGLDTSNYTTSAALYDSETGRAVSEKKLLLVEEGAAGLRQSDALFSHIRQLPEVLERLFAAHRPPLAAVCASDRPRAAEGSYMPAFLAGDCAASAVALAMGLPKYSCSHQQGHIAAALYSAGALDWLSREFYAFHVSGGTTECLLVRPQKGLFSTELVAKTLDLNAGQLVDRTGLLLGLRFPCGPELDRLACSAKESPPRPHPVFQGCDCHFSGAQNQCEALLQKGAPPPTVAGFALDYILAAVSGMTERVLREHGERPVLYAGGVMSNTLLRAALEKRFGGRFAAPEFSADNAAGAAVIGWLLHKGQRP